MSASSLFILFDLLRKRELFINHFKNGFSIYYKQKNLIQVLMLTSDGSTKVVLVDIRGTKICCEDIYAFSIASSIYSSTQKNKKVAVVAALPCN